jgi:adenylylsulfate kinase-like enzyme
MQDLSNLICQEPGCPLATSGTCLEGVDDPHNCPHSKEVTGLDAPAGDEDHDPEEPSDYTSDWQPVAGGYELSVQEANAITAGHEATVIILAGEPEAGKTTLLATIYELFSKGEVPGFQFAGTETILAFERACFPSRTVSGNLKPKTDRTTRLRPWFYHLCLREGHAEGIRRHLLLGDVSGEVFQRASDKLAEAQKLEYLRRANVFVLLLDGDKVRSKLERQDVLQRAILTLRSLLQAKVLTAESTVQILVSKFDCFDPENANANDFLAHMKIELETRFSKEFVSFSVREIAARPANDRVPFAYGVTDLLPLWLRERTLLWDASLPARPTATVMREADEYLWRHDREIPSE